MHTIDVLLIADAMNVGSPPFGLSDHWMKELSLSFEVRPCDALPAGTA